METIQEFVARVSVLTGLRFQDLPDLSADALLEGAILARRGGCYVVTLGYPVAEDRETERKTYNAFGVVGREHLG